MSVTFNEVPKSLRQLLHFKEYLREYTGLVFSPKSIPAKETLTFTSYLRTSSPLKAWLLRGTYSWWKDLQNNYCKTEPSFVLRYHHTMNRKSNKAIVHILDLDFLTRSVYRSPEPKSGLIDIVKCWIYKFEGIFIQIKFNILKVYIIKKQRKFSHTYNGN